VTFDGAEVEGSAAFGGITNFGGCSRPISVEALIGVGSADLAASLGLWAKAFKVNKLRPSAWLRIKPIVLIWERRKRAWVI
jgi:hypothetical protein